jgi:hypothetical protein
LLWLLLLGGLGWSIARRLLSFVAGFGSATKSHQFLVGHQIALKRQTKNSFNALVGFKVGAD